MARLGTLTALSAAFPGMALSRVNSYPFGLGVASGSPLPDGIVLWTRLVPQGILGDGFANQPVKVKWEVAEDERFSSLAFRGEVTALPELAHSVHVDVRGLRPGRWYWYRFTTGDAVSPVGRTRTAPAADSPVDKLKLAVASCQHWEFGQYAAHRHIAAAQPDLVAFLGDYIYEWGPYELAHPNAPRRSDESFSLADYRRRYAQYKSDPHLQAAHHAAPWIVTWDDHEVANDYANDRDERLDPDFLERRAAAYQAFYEHMPIRVPSVPAPGKAFAHLQIYHHLDWGQLARFFILDDRQYRSWQVCPRPGIGGSNSVTSACRERMDADRTLLGQQQETWLARGMATSGAKWNFLAQQTLMSQSSQLPMEKPGDGRFWTDGWDGYPAARNRLLDDIAKHRPANPVVLSGDVHTFYAAEVRRDFMAAAGNDNPVLASEFCGTSITSNSRPQTRTDQYVDQNPHIQYGRSDRRGYMMLELSGARLEASFMGLDDVRSVDSGIQPLARFTVESGRPRVQQMD